MLDGKLWGCSFAVLFVDGFWFPIVVLHVVGNVAALKDGASYFILSLPMLILLL